LLVAVVLDVAVSLLRAGKIILRVNVERGFGQWMYEDKVAL
jgi:hypothetical protein